MNVDLEVHEVQLILDMLNSVPVKGENGMLMTLNLIYKLKEGLREKKSKGQEEEVKASGEE